MGVTPGLPCDGNPPSLRTGKRAWIRAQRQANQHGHTWYRGRVLWSEGTQHLLVDAPPPRRTRRPRPVTTLRGATARLKVVCLQELHWSQTCQFNVGGWSVVVSAGQDKSDGVMVLVNPKFKQSQVKYDEIVRGRLLRVQIAVDDTKVEIFCCYQFVWQTALTKDDNLRKRQTLLANSAHRCAPLPSVPQ